ncbi:MAG: hypothetical protein Q9219_006514 [cf. Caloplaca sp. 3 TL-2023]
MASLSDRVSMGDDGRYSSGQLPPEKPYDTGDHDMEDNVPGPSFNFGFTCNVPQASFNVSAPVKRSKPEGPEWDHFKPLDPGESPIFTYQNGPTSNTPPDPHFGVVPAQVFLPTSNQPSENLSGADNAQDPYGLQSPGSEHALQAMVRRRIRAVRPPQEAVQGDAEEENKRLKKTVASLRTNLDSNANEVAALRLERHQLQVDSGNLLAQLESVRHEANNTNLANDKLKVEIGICRRVLEAKKDIQTQYDEATKEQLRIYRQECKRLQDSSAFLKAQTEAELLKRDKTIDEQKKVLVEAGIEPEELNKHAEPVEAQINALLQASQGHTECHQLHHDLTVKVTELSTQNKSLEEHIERLHHDIAGKKNDFDALNASVGSMSTLEERLEKAQDDCQDLEIKCKILTGQKDALCVKLEAQEKAAAAEEEEHEVTKTKLTTSYTCWRESLATANSENDILHADVRKRDNIIMKLNKQNSAASEEIKNRDQQIAERDGELGTLRKEKEEVDKKAHAYEAAYSRLHVDFKQNSDQWTSEKVELLKTIDTRDTTIVDLHQAKDQEISQLNAQCKELSEKYKSLEKHAEGAFQEHRQEWRATDQANETKISQLEASLEQANNQYEAMVETWLEKFKAKDEQISGLQVELESASGRYITLMQERDASKALAMDLTEKVQGQDQEMVQLRTKYQDTCKELLKRDDTVEELSACNSNQDKEVSQLKAKYNDASAQLLKRAEDIKKSQASNQDKDNEILRMKVECEDASKQLLERQEDIKKLEENALNTDKEILRMKAERDDASKQLLERQWDIKKLEVSALNKNKEDAHVHAKCDEVSSQLLPDEKCIEKLEVEIQHKDKEISQVKAECDNLSRQLLERNKDIEDRQACEQVRIEEISKLNAKHAEDVYQYDLLKANTTREAQERDRLIDELTSHGIEVNEKFKKLEAENIKADEEWKKLKTEHTTVCAQLDNTEAAHVGLGNAKDQEIINLQFLLFSANERLKKLEAEFEAGTRSKPHKLHELTDQVMVKLEAQDHSATDSDDAGVTQVEAGMREKGEQTVPAFNQEVEGNKPADASILLEEEHRKIVEAKDEEISKLVKERDEASEQLSDERRKLKNLQQDMAEMGAAIEEDRGREAGKDNEISELSRKNREAEAKVKSSFSIVTQLEARTADQDRIIQQNGQAIQVLKKELRHLRENAQKHEAETAELRKLAADRVTKGQRQFNKRVGQLKDEHDKELADAHAQFKQISEEQVALADVEFERLQTAMAGLTADTNAVHKRISELQQTVRIQQEQLDTLRAEKAPKQVEASIKKRPANELARFSPSVSPSPSGRKPRGGGWLGRSRGREQTKRDPEYWYSDWSGEEEDEEEGRKSGSVGEVIGVRPPQPSRRSSSPAKVLKGGRKDASAQTSEAHVPTTDCSVQTTDPSLGQLRPEPNDADAATQITAIQPQPPPHPPSTGPRRSWWAALLFWLCFLLMAAAMISAALHGQQTRRERLLWLRANDWTRRAAVPVCGGGRGGTPLLGCLVRSYPL